MRLKSFQKFFMMLACLFAFSVAQAAETPDGVIRATSDEMISALKQNKATLEKNPEKVFDLVEKILVPRFDFETISQWVMGRSWRNATPAQRTEFTTEFKRLLINAYAGVLLDYTDEKINILPLPRGAASRDDLTVRSEIVSKGKEPVAINYAMIKDQKGRWMVYDVSVEGVSIVTSYRSEIRELVALQGIDGMIKTIKSKNSGK